MGEGCRLLFQFFPTALVWHGDLRPCSELGQRLESANPAKIDPLWKLVRRTSGIRREMRLGKRMSREIAVEASHD